MSISFNTERTENQFVLTQETWVISVGEKKNLNRYIEENKKKKKEDEEILVIWYYGALNKPLTWSEQKIKNLDTHDRQAKNKSLEKEEK